MRLPSRAVSFLICVKDRRAILLCIFHADKSALKMQRASHANLGGIQSFEINNKIEIS